MQTHSSLVKLTVNYYIDSTNTASPCTGGQTFQQCGPLCPQTCENINATCIGGCAEGCFCPMGQVVDDAGNCIDESACPG